MSSLTTKAIVLSRVNYGEADRIMQILTPDSGKIGVIAKAVRREKSKLAGGIELLAVCDLVLHQGRGELAIVTSARLDTFYGHILEDYDRLQFAYYVLKDVSKAAEILSEPAFFELTRQALVSLNDMTIDRRVTELWYRLQMAILLGVGINLATDENGMKLVEDARYRYDVDENAFVYDERGQFMSDHIKLLRVASAQSPHVIAQIKDVTDLLDTCEIIGRIAHE
ncbi:MAG: DNA repair protein RecO [Candidatus Saccharimonadales bacterium]|jgi:DNA repair protein RecO (recombination protein O)